MERIVMVFLIGCVCLSAHFAAAWDGLCPSCKVIGQKSRVYEEGGCTVTLMSCGGGLYDEDGRYVPPPSCNTVACSYRCSNGHRFSEGMRSVLPENIGQATAKE